MRKIKSFLNIKAWRHVPVETLHTDMKLSFEGLVWIHHSIIKGLFWSMESGGFEESIDSGRFSIARILASKDAASSSGAAGPFQCPAYLEFHRGLVLGLGEISRLHMGRLCARTNFPKSVAEDVRRVLSYDAHLHTC